MSGFDKAVLTFFGTVLVVGGAAYLLDAEAQRRNQKQARLARRKRAVSYIAGLYREILQEVHLGEAPPLRFHTRVPNAASVNGEQIVVNPYWAVQVDEDLERRFGVKGRRAAWVIVLLHEIAHHVERHSTPTIHAWCAARAPFCEWDADAFAAEHAARLGVRPSEAHAVLVALGNGCPLSHGCSRDRVARIVGIIGRSHNPFLVPAPAYTVWNPQRALFT